MLRRFFDSKKKTKENIIVAPGAGAPQNTNIKLPTVDEPLESLQNRNLSSEVLLTQFVEDVTAQFAKAGGIKYSHFSEQYKNEYSTEYSLDKVSSDYRKDSTVVGGNNLTILFNGKSPFFAIQFSDMPAWHDELVGKLSASGNPPDYFARTHGEPSSRKPRRYQPKSDDLNPFNQESRIVGSRVEVLTPLESRCINMIDERERIKLATQVGADLCRIMTHLTENNVIWTDIKPGNILLRSDNTIAIADKKGFCPMEYIQIRKPPDLSDKGPKQLTALLNYSEQYISPNSISRLRHATIQTDGEFTIEHATQARKQIFQNWQKEYSYQLAVVLYDTATKHSNDTFDPRQGFDFKKPVFESEEGLLLKLIITKLSDPNPNERWSVELASKMLSSIHQHLEKPLHHGRIENKSAVIHNPVECIVLHNQHSNKKQINLNESTKADSEETSKSSPRIH